MNDNDKELLAKSLAALQIPKTHVTVGLSNLIASNKDVRSLLIHRRLPDSGWSDHEIQWFLYTVATLDTNLKTPISSKIMTTSSNSSSVRWCGVGEREGRVYSNLVAQRHFGLSHGVGRSGDITEPQPKAVGSSVLAKLTLLMVMDGVRRGSGLHAQTAAAHGILLPLCTGMSMALVLSSLRESGATSCSNTKERDVVLWSRIDQKSCFKAVTAAGLTCVVVPTARNGDCVVTDMDAMCAAIKQYKGRVLAVITTTSCFAPRVPDSVDEVAKLCQEFDVCHVVNNAYGLQCAVTCKRINRACVVGRVDAVVCSTDKNFLVPVGGAIVMSPSDTVIHNIGTMYAGRASASPMVDLFITLLSMGLSGYKKLLEQRQVMLTTFPVRLNQVAEKYGERMLACPSNSISFGITVDGLARPRRRDEDENDYLQAVEKDISRFGAMLFSRCVSGTRIVPRCVTNTIGGQEFLGFGSSCDDYPHAYMTAACAIGVGPDEIDEFLVRLDKTFKEFKKKQ
jgi:O-phospho-L-seryl-tRNASec:L-selenocysteinyl-tRNA synthase